MGPRLGGRPGLLAPGVRGKGKPSRNNIGHTNGTKPAAAQPKREEPPKPFALPELLARVEGLLRHTGRRAATLQAFDAVIDPDNHIVTQNGTRVELTPREFDLLLALVRARGQLLYREALYERVWGLDSNAGPRTVDIHIHRLRKKLHWDHKIVTVPKVGYKLLP